MIRVFVLCDDFWHPAKIPEQGLAELGSRGFEFDWIENASDFSIGRLAGYPLVILAKSNNVSSADQTNWMTEEIQAAFKTYVRQGNGLLVVHSGLAGYQEARTLRSMVGGAFTRHPPQCLVTFQPDGKHSLAKHVDSFTLTDEHYFVDLDDHEAQVFLTTTSEHGAQVGGWTRLEGSGRVCAISPGHNLEVWLHPSFQTLLVNALNWCAGQLSEKG